MSGLITYSQEIGDQLLVGLRTLLKEYNKLVADVEKVRSAAAYALQDQVVFSATGPGLSVDANAADVELDAACVIQHRGMRYAFNAETAIDLSAMAGGGATIAQAGSGAMWIFGNYNGTVAQAEVDVDAQAHADAVTALAQYSVATNVLPPTLGDVCVGVVQVTEGGTGTFTWGTDSITDETETYYSLNGAPGVITPLATFALEASEATFTYGAGVFRLGTATNVTLTGKDACVLSGSVVEPGNVGAWLFYALADDVECVVQTGVTHVSLDAARSHVKSLKPNPLLPLLGAIYIENGTASDFTPGTTELDVAGITATFDIVPGIAASVDAFSDLTGSPFGTIDGIAVA
jgi:hypothetical protein